MESTFLELVSLCLRIFNIHINGITARITAVAYTMVATAMLDLAAKLEEQNPSKDMTLRRRMQWNLWNGCVVLLPKALCRIRTPIWLTPRCIIIYSNKVSTMIIHHPHCHHLFAVGADSINTWWILIKCARTKNCFLANLRTCLRCTSHSKCPWKSALSRK